MSVEKSGEVWGRDERNKDIKDNNHIVSKKFSYTFCLVCLILGNICLKDFMLNIFIRFLKDSKQISFIQKVKSF